jgi:4-carboxymuconolactone decarboxylase
MAAVSHDVYDALARLAGGSLEGSIELKAADRASACLDERSAAIARIAAMVALDAPPASYATQITDAVEAGVTAEEMLATLRAVAPLVGASRVVAAAPELMLALGLRLPGGGD